MRIIVTHYGGPDALQVVEEECPEPKEGEVRVRVLAAGVSLPDIMAREGVHPETPRVPKPERRRSCSGREALPARSFLSATGHPLNQERRNIY